MEEWNKEEKKYREAKTNAGIEERLAIIVHVHSSHV